MKKVIGYVSTKDLGTLKEQDIKNLDVINIAFGLIERHRVVWDSCGNEEYLPKIREINPDIKIVLSVGGWGADGFSQAARTEEGRALFAVSAVSLVETYGLDGIDLDWEYPVCGGLPGSTREPLWPASVPMSMIRKITRCF